MYRRWVAKKLCLDRSRLASRLAVSIRVDKVVPREEVRDGGELRAVALRVVVQLEQRHGEQLHVFGHCENLCRRAEGLEKQGWMMCESREKESKEER